MPDRPGEGPRDEDLPPDPWAGIGPSSPEASGPGPGVPRGGPGGTAHPAGGPGDPPHGSGVPPHGFEIPPTRSRSLWQHPAVWVGVVVLALILLVGALLEPRPAPQREPSPDAVSTAGSDPRS